MIPLLIYIFSKRYRKPGGAYAGLQISKFLKARFLILFISILVVLFLIIPISSRSQHQQLNYKVIQGGNQVGWMRLEKTTTGNQSSLLLVSEIKALIILFINVSAKESSFFNNGQLIYSSQFRTKNGTTKVNKQTRFVDNKYEVLENGEKLSLNYHFIGTNLLSLYFIEPIGINFVYCDKQEAFVQIKKTGDGGYKIKFPDGNSNCFYYSGGICTKIKVNTSFYSADIILNP